MVGRQEIGQHENGASKSSFVHHGDAGSSGSVQVARPLVRPELPRLDRDARDQLSKVGSLRVQSELAGRELREVERAVEKYSQPNPGRSDDLEILALRVVHLTIDAAQEDIREPEHGVEGRAELVAQRHQVVHSSSPLAAVGSGQRLLDGLTWRFGRLDVDARPRAPGDQSRSNAPRRSP